MSNAVVTEPTGCQGRRVSFSLYSRAVLNRRNFITDEEDLDKYFEEESVMGDQISPSMIKKTNLAPMAHQEDQLGLIYEKIENISQELSNVKNAISLVNGANYLHSRNPMLGQYDGERKKSWDNSLNGEGTGLEDSNKIRLVFGEKSFQTTLDTLSRVPNSRLGMLSQCRDEQEILQLADRYDKRLQEYHFDRRPRFFSDILSLYETGKLHVTEEGCMIAFMEELEYWGIDERRMAQCCHQKYMEQREYMELSENHHAKVVYRETFPKNKFGEIQKKVWDTFEHPNSSVMARIVGILSMVCIVISTIILTLDTLPYFQEQAPVGGDYFPFAVTEACYMTWFTFEFLIRLTSCPDKIRFVKVPLNIIDVLAILPYFISLAFYRYVAVMPASVEHTDLEFNRAWDTATEGQIPLPSGGVTESSPRSERRDMTTDEEVRRIAQFFRLIRIVKMFRIIRIFKLARHSGALKALGRTVKNSYRELGMLILFLGMGVLIFSSLVYTFENDDPDSNFLTMLDAYWWALITMTTVGYGDLSPTTGLGRVTGAICATFGVLVIALPIPIIGNQFTRYYQREQRMTKLKERLGHLPPPIKLSFKFSKKSKKWREKSDTDLTINAEGCQHQPPLKVGGDVKPEPDPVGKDEGSEFKSNRRSTAKYSISPTSSVGDFDDSTAGLPSKLRPDSSVISMKT